MTDILLVSLVVVMLKTCEYDSHTFAFGLLTYID